MNDEILKKLDKEEMALAPIQKRIFALVVDDLIISGLVIIALLDKMSSNNITQTIEAINKAVILIMLVKIAYQTMFVSLYGATPGKMLMRIRVVDIDTLDNPKMPQSLIRASIRIASEIFFYLGFAWALSNSVRQTWQDKVAKTIVLDASKTISN